MKTIQLHIEGVLPTNAFDQADFAADQVRVHRGPTNAKSVNWTLGRPDGGFELATVNAGDVLDVNGHHGPAGMPRTPWSGGVWLVLVIERRRIVVSRETSIAAALRIASERPRSRFTPAVRQDVWSRFKRGETVRTIAGHYGVHTDSIRKVLRADTGMKLPALKQAIREDMRAA